MLLRRRRSIVAHPPLLSKVPATKVVPISTQEQKIEKYKTPTVSLPGGQDLRARANSIANRRHTLIQYQLAAAKFNTSLRHTRREGYMEKQEPEQESLDFAWDEYVKAVASRRHSEASRTNKKAGRGLGRQLEALRMYMESRRSSQAAVNAPNLRQSELQKFEVLQQTVQQSVVGSRPSPRGAKASLHHPHDADGYTASRSTRSLVTAVVQRRRGSVWPLQQTQNGHTDSDKGREAERRARPHAHCAPTQQQR